MKRTAESRTHLHSCLSLSLSLSLVLTPIPPPPPSFPNLRNLKETGFFENSGARPGDLVAINLGSNALSGSVDWILGKVLSYDSESSTYQIADEDVESSTKTYSLPEGQVMQLGNFDKLSKGDRVYAVYPDTTSFYQATVAGVRKTQGGAGPSTVYVNFLDDHDEVGFTHDKAVLMAHTMKM